MLLSDRLPRMEKTLNGSDPWSALPPHAPHQDGKRYMKQNTMSARDALTLLREGNARFVSATETGPHRTAERRSVTALQGQEPFVVVVSCADSRVPLSVIFDQGIGDIFGLRIAGNICSPELIGSIEYAVLHLGTPLVVMLAHSKCGAVTAVVQGEHVDGNLVPLVQHIAPAVERARGERPHLTGTELVNASIQENMWFQIETLFARSEHVSSAVRTGKVEVVGAHYDVEHGNVTWYGIHPRQATLLK